MICKALTRAKHADAVQLLRLPAENCFGRGVTDACNIPVQLDRREILSGAADQHAGVVWYEVLDKRNFEPRSPLSTRATPSLSDFT